MTEIYLIEEIVLNPRTYETVESSTTTPMTNLGYYKTRESAQRVIDKFDQNIHKIQAQRYKRYREEHMDNLERHFQDVEAHNRVNELVRLAGLSPNTRDKKVTWRGPSRYEEWAAHHPHGFSFRIVALKPAV